MNTPRSRSSASSGSKGLQWADMLEEELDGLFREARAELTTLPAGPEEAEELVLAGRRRVDGLVAVFAQLLRKCKAVFQSNCKLEAMLLDAQAELALSEGECEHVRRELKGRTLEVRSLELQLRQTVGEKEGAEEGGGVAGLEREMGTLRAELELEIEKYRHSQSSEERLSATVSLLQQENSSLHEYVQSLYAELTSATLSRKYLEKELTGRIQQLQLLSSGVAGTELQKLWRQINTEISLQKNKALLLAYGSRDKITDSVLQARVEEEERRERVQELREKVLGFASQREVEERRGREVVITKRDQEPLGMSITGGLEHGVPILISNLDEGKAAQASGQLQIGDTILSVNRESLVGKTHSEAVSLLKSVGSTIRLEVIFAIGIPEHEEENGNKEITSDELQKPPEIDTESLPPLTNPMHVTEQDTLSETAHVTVKQASLNHDGTKAALSNHSISTLAALPESSTSESDSQTDLEKLASAFALSPSAQNQSALAFADTGMFRYDEGEESTLPSPSAKLPLNVSTVPHTRVPGVSSPSVEAYSPHKQLPVTHREEHIASTAAVAHSPQRETPIPANSEPKTSTERDEASCSTPKTADAVVFASRRVQRLRPSGGSEHPSGSTYYMRLAAVPVQSMIPDSDDVPLFSV